MTFLNTHGQKNWRICINFHWMKYKNTMKKKLDYASGPLKIHIPTTINANITFGDLNPSCFINKPLSMVSSHPCLSVLSFQLSVFNCVSLSLCQTLSHPQWALSGSGSITHFPAAVTYLVVDSFFPGSTEPHWVSLCVCTTSVAGLAACVSVGPCMCVFDVTMAVTLWATQTQSPPSSDSPVSVSVYSLISQTLSPFCSQALSFPESIFRGVFSDVLTLGERAQS